MVDHVLNYNVDLGLTLKTKPKILITVMTVNPLTWGYSPFKCKICFI